MQGHASFHFLQRPRRQLPGHRVVSLQLQDTSALPVPAFIRVHPMPAAAFATAKQELDRGQRWSGNAEIFDLQVRRIDAAVMSAFGMRFKCKRTNELVGIIGHSGIVTTLSQTLKARFKKMIAMKRNIVPARVESFQRMHSITRCTDRTHLKARIDGASAT